MDSETKRGRPRDAATHQAILNAANGILAEQGYRGFSIEAVASKAGVSKASIYRRWRSKGELLVDLYMLGLQVETDAPARNSAGVSAEEAFAGYVAQTVERLGEPIWAQTLSGLAAECLGNPELAEIVRVRIVRPRREAGARILERAVRAGELPSGTDIPLLIDFVFGTVWYRLLLGHAPLDRDFIEAMRRQVFHPSASPR